MRRLVIIALFLNAALLCARFLQELPARAESKGLAQDNGDCNGDGTRDVSDAVYLLDWLFLGGGPPVAIAQSPALTPEQEEILSHLSMVDLPVGQGLPTARTLRVSGVNLQIVNGMGSTETENAAGNLIVGYQELRGGSTPDPDDLRTGSHSIVVGHQHSYSSYGGLLAGARNSVTARFSSVSGGFVNTASGEYSAVSGGAGNTASGERSAVSGGGGNKASSLAASVSGGLDNEASGNFSSAGGGTGNKATGDSSSVTGGSENTASAERSSVSGGRLNAAKGIAASVNGGSDNQAIGNLTCISGGMANQATGDRSSVGGGRQNVSAGSYSSVSGGFQRSTNNDDDWRGGSLLEDQ